MADALLLCGVIGGPLFVLVFTIDGATRPGYRATYHPVSALALGSRGWLQTTNFLVTGLLMLAAALGMRSALSPGAAAVVAPVAVGVFGVALVASGCFPMDPMRGYPPGTAGTTPEDPSRLHHLHDQAGAFVFGSLPIAMLAMTWRFANDGAWTWAAANVLAAAVYLAVFLAFGAAWERDGARTGLLQRASIVMGWGWVSVVAASLLGAS